MITLRKAKIRQLRADARRLVAIARHLREEAHSLSMEERGEKARANFFSKRSEIDERIILTPSIPEKSLF